MNPLPSNPANVPPAPAHTSRRRRWLLLTVGAVLVAAASLGYFWYRSPGPLPPEVPSRELDGEVAKSLQLARAKVLDNSASAAAWGELGMLFWANGLRAQAQPCFM